ncbi:hypothetical protein WMY93_003263 [Mugilogobius chulae]|uniref:C1q domain-containing protein n=1 Tax=Mugilogobius chulae TaxID=88201 RepID=A0AAW0Q5Y6_9GOBI
MDKMTQMETKLDDTEKELTELKSITQGIFTATVKGVYFFRFTMFNNLNSTPNSVLILRKNEEQIVTLWDVSATDGNDTGSNAAVLSLEAGDTVHVELSPNRQVYDDQAHYNTFTGFLLFTI